jgi:CDP-glycerol glycerophosphotransferase (TagB/SpsB family)
MNKQNLKVHYMTKREDIYKNFSNYNLTSENKIIFDFNYINGNFLEKYLEIFLKLKSTISGAKIYSINNLFYNIEYLTYICLGHGISYLKDFLYIDYYSINIYNKILLPNSKIIISNAKKYGWKDKNIIKIGLPRWDTFSFNNRKIISFQNRSIFMMFTWRDLKQNNNHSQISQYYFKNIIELINNYALNIILKENNITLYFCLHHMMEKYKLLFNINKNIKYIAQNQIIECLINSELFITDFSSVLFDFIFRKKPYIMFIPDSEDLDLQSIYSKSYYDKINYLKNGSFFENRFFKVKDTVDKIIYYINNNFELDSKMEKFYKYINLKSKNNIHKFIQYLKKI